MASLKCKEILCFVFSGVLFVSGLVIITFSVLLTFRVINHFSFIPGSALGPLILLFLLGIVHLFLPWLGVNGPRREHNFHILFFMVFTLILLLCEFTVGVWAMVLRDEVSIESVELMTKAFNSVEIKEGHNKKWAKLQSKFKCCGLHGPLDYGTTCPVSCLDDSITNPDLVVCYEDSCQKPFTKYVKGILVEAAVIGFLSTVYQALCLFVFWTFFRALREERAERLARRSALQRQMSEGSHPKSAEAPLVYPPSYQAPQVPPSTSPPPSSPPASSH